MKNTKIAFILAVLAVVFMAPSVSFAITIQGNDTSAVTIAIPATQGNGITAATPSPVVVPPIQDNDNSNGTVTVPTRQDNDTTTGTPSTPDPVTPPTSGGSPSSSGSSSGGGSRVIIPTVCQLVASPLKAGDVSLEVTKLQTFLKNTEKLNVNITGTYDAQTVEAVKAFQTKYASVVLAPWGITTPTGNVYMTTLKKINSLACGTVLTMTPLELAQINAYKNRVVNGTAPIITSDEVGTIATPSTSPSTDTSDDTDTSVEQTAAVAETPLFSKIWNLIKRVFGR